MHKEMQVPVLGQKAKDTVTEKIKPKKINCLKKRYLFQS